MIRVQVLLQEEQDRRLERLARLTGRSRSSLVREAVEMLLRERQQDGPDPLLALIGQAGPAGRDDVSDRHDEILADAALDRDE